MLLMIFSISLALVGFLVAWFIFYKKESVPGADGTILGFRKVLYNKYYVDELYHNTVIRGTIGLANGLWRFVDKTIIDGFINGVGFLAGGISRTIRVMQTGMVHDYMLSMIIGVSVLVIYILTLFIR
jgi:NADH-quinone oxidoreductase subunit L